MDAIERIFSPAIEEGKANAAADAVAKPGVPSLPVPTVADAGGATEERAKPASMCALAAFVMRHMRINYDARESAGIDSRLRYAIQAQTCSYDDEQREVIKSFGLKPERSYCPVTSTKVRSFHAMLMELSQYGSDIPFEIRPTPDPEVPDEIESEVLRGIYAELSQLLGALEQGGVTSLPPEAMARLQGLVEKAAADRYDRVANAKGEFARNCARRMQRKIADLMYQGGYAAAWKKCLEDFCVFGTAVVVGPVMRNVARNRSVSKRLKKGGKVRVIKRVIESIPTFERVSPVDCYPSPDAVEVSDGVLCIRVRYTREELWRFRRASADVRAGGEEGWRDTAIEKLLSEREFGCRLDEFPADDSIESAAGRDSDDTSACKFEGVRCFAFVSGHDLLQIGITRAQDGVRIENSDFYYTETVVVGGLVVFCRIYDERMGCPLSKSVAYAVPDSWWGESVADKLACTQSVMNNAIVSLMRNMGPASAQMLWVNDASRLIDKSPDALMAEPGKVFAFGASFTGQTPPSGAPMGVLQIPSNAGELLSVAKWATAQADLDSGIPAYSEGTGGSMGGALRTAAGQQFFAENSTRGVKDKARNLDEGVICGAARKMADWILVYDDDMDLKGDVEVIPVGLMGKLLKAQNDQLRLQMLNLCLNSQVLLGYLGVKGILALFRPMLKNIDVNPDEVCPSKERMEFLEEVDDVKQLAMAAQARNGVAEAEAGAAAAGAGMQPGIQPVTPQGGVAERRGAA